MPSATTGLEKTLQVLNGMKAEGVIGEYAICGAVAAFRYLEAFVTIDLDISVYLPGVDSPLVTFSPILEHLARIGVPIVWRGEGLVIGRWPVQFITASLPLDRAALDNADTVDINGTVTRFWRAEHLMAKCLDVGRPKDQARLQQFLEQPFNEPLFCDIVTEFELGAKWREFCHRFNQRDVCDPNA